MTRNPNTSIDKMPIYPDGKSRIYAVDDSGVETNIVNGVYFRSCALGFTRVFTAKSENVTINRVIRIPYCSGFDTHDRIEILNDGKYEIVMISVKYDSIPSEIELSLKQLELFTV